MIKHPLYPRANCYLSGGIQYAANNGASWRIDCSAQLKLLKYYPIDISRMDREYAARYGELYFVEDEKNHLQYKSNFRQHFVNADLELVVKDSDALIVFYDESVRRGAGTTSECQVAFNNDIPVFIVSDYPNWQSEVPGWLQALSTRVFTNFGPLYDYLETLPYGILKRDRYGNHGVSSNYLCSLCGNVFEKSKHHFVSRISPTYCGSCVDLITKTHEGHRDRYEFILQQLELESEDEWKTAMAQ